MPTDSEDRRPLRMHAIRNITGSLIEDAAGASATVRGRGDSDPAPMERSRSAPRTLAYPNKYNGDYSPPGGAGINRGIRCFARLLAFSVANENRPKNCSPSILSEELNG